MELAAGVRERSLERADVLATVEAGARDVRLVVDEGLSVSILVSGGEAGREARVGVGAGDRWLAWADARTGEPCVISGLPPEPVTVLADADPWNDRGDRAEVGLATGVMPGVVPVPVRVELGPGYALRCRLLLPEGGEATRVEIRPPDCPPLHAWTRPAFFWRENIPPGPWRVLVRFTLLGETREETREVPADFRGELDLR